MSVWGKPEEEWTLMAGGLEMEVEALWRSLEKVGPGTQEEASSRSLERDVLGKEAADLARGRET